MHFYINCNFGIGVLSSEFDKKKPTFAKYLPLRQKDLSISVDSDKPVRRCYGVKVGLLAIVEYRVWEPDPF